jgi:acylpyruvate hydrolase
MRLVSFVQKGEVRTGVVNGGEVVDLSNAHGGVPQSISGLIRLGSLDAVKEWASAAPAHARLPLEGLQLAIPETNPGKVVCLGLNYADHAAEGGHLLPTYPALFLRARSSLVAAGAPLVRPACSERLDFEAELMVIVGRGGRHLSEDEALDAVFGYTIFNDGSVRDYQRKTTQWTAGKNFDATGAVGPWIVTRDELPPGVEGMGIRCLLNGKVMQESNTSRMIFNVRRTVSILSEIMTLEPGDLIAMGTPDGVGNARKPPVYMRPGDVVAVEIDGIGRLENPVVAEEAIPA